MPYACSFYVHHMVAHEYALITWPSYCNTHMLLSLTVLFLIFTEFDHLTLSSSRWLERVVLARYVCVTAINIRLWYCLLAVFSWFFAFSQVLLARQKDDNKVYAVKVLQKVAIMKRNEVKHIMAERNVLLKNVTHPFLVGLHYSFQTADKLYFVLDYVNGGEVSLESSEHQINILCNISSFPCWSSSPISRIAIKPSPIIFNEWL